MGFGKLCEEKPLPVSKEKSVRKSRTFTGCWNCRKRKVKCDETSPECRACIKHGITCSGYGQKLVWVTSDQKTYKPNGRRFLQCESTWDKTSVLDPEALDYYVSLCDAAPYVKDFTVEWCQLRIPFGAFPSKENCLQCVPSPRLPRSLIYGAPLDDEEAFLFQHYVNHVAFIMMPYEDKRNPWRSSYPAVALYYMSHHQKFLYSALLAQAAFNLAHLGQNRERMLELATKFYTSAMKDLRNGLMTNHKDYGSFIAAIMTLMFVEIYSGNSSTWRAHFNGAWNFLKEYDEPQPWNASTFAESSTQSLCLIKIVSDTSDPHQLRELDFCRRSLISAISSSESFGFTMGAPGLLMTCIDDIRRLYRDIKFDRLQDPIDVVVADLLLRLDQCHAMAMQELQTTTHATSPEPEHNKMAFHHLSAFISATYIYFYRTIFNKPPKDVQQYVREVFHHATAFFAIGEGNLSLWPAFIAAVEAYEECDIVSAKRWLDNASKMGMGNRIKVKIVVEEVWRLRESIAIDIREDIGDVIVDWRDVMANLGMDIVLV